MLLFAGDEALVLELRAILNQEHSFPKSKPCAWTMSTMTKNMPFTPAMLSGL